jgi:hypothetical protein
VKASLAMLSSCRRIMSEEVAWDGTAYKGLMATDDRSKSIFSAATHQSKASRDWTARTRRQHTFGPWSTRCIHFGTGNDNPVPLVVGLHPSQELYLALNGIYCTLEWPTTCQLATRAKGSSRTDASRTSTMNWSRVTTSTSCAFSFSRQMIKCSG